LGLLVGPHWDEVLAQLSAVHRGWFVLAAALNLALLPLTARMWDLLLPDQDRVGVSAMLRVCAVKSLISNTIPITGLGHASAVWLLVQSRGVRLAAALSAVIVLDTALQGLGKVSLLLLAGLYVPLPEGTPWLAGLVALVLLGVVLFARAHSGAERPGVVTALRARFLAPLAAALRETPHPWLLGQAFAIVLLKFFVEWCALLAMQVAMGLDPSPRAALVVIAAVSVATSVAVTPGNLGTYQAAALAGYALCGAFPGHALSLSLLHHVAILLPTSAAGLIVLLADRSGRARRAALIPGNP
jgi:uncharacterized membrane protein YbhN (UPF0104 family)